MDDNDAIVFYVLFMILTSVFITGFAGGLIHSADFLDKQTKASYSLDIFLVLGWVFTANIPSTSNIFITVSVIRIVGIIQFIYSLIFAYMVARYFRGV